MRVYQEVRGGRRGSSGGLGAERVGVVDLVVRRRDMRLKEYQEVKGKG